MLRKATQDDLPALVALRCKAARTNRTDAAGWLQNVAGLENILLLVKSGAPPAAMLAAVPVEYGQHHGVCLQRQGAHVLGSRRGIEMHGQILVLESDVGNFQHVLARADFGKGEIALCRGGRARRLRAVGQGEQLHGSLYRRLLGVLHDTARYRNVFGL